nr:hypothetical protein [uncultured Sphingomonas sp.]
MSTNPYRSTSDPVDYVDFDALPAESAESSASAQFDQVSWSAAQDEDVRATRGGRIVLGWGLALLAALWIGYSGWSAGRALAAESLNSPAIAQWIAILTGPLALLGLVWIMFGRTRRKEAERFNRTVVAMRTEAQSLQDVLGVLSRQIDENHKALGVMAGDLMGLGDQAASRLGAVTNELNAGSAKLAEHGAALDRAAESARTDIGVLLADLPQAEATALRMAEALREAGRDASEQAATFETRVASLAERAQSADQIVANASQRLLERLREVETAGSSASARISDAGNETGATVDALLTRAADALSEIRNGIDAQSAAVTALLASSEAGIGRAGQDAAQALGDHLGAASQSIDVISAKIAEQERSTQRIIADLDVGMAALDDRFLDLARSGDERAAHVQTALGRLREELEGLSSATSAHDNNIEGLSQRTAALRDGIEGLSLTLQSELAGHLDTAEAGAARLLSAAEAARPHVEAMRDASSEATARIEHGAAQVAEQQAQLAQLMTSVDLGVTQAESRLAELGAAIVSAHDEAGRLSAETAPALVAALLQVRETAGHAADRAREAIAKVIPESAEGLSQATRAALEKAVTESVRDKLAELDGIATRAVENAREASSRLTEQMLSIGQSAAALEAHIERNREAQRKDSGEEFARQVSLLMDSMNSASIDVQKILSDEVDEKAWNSYLKGNRGVFTRRAARLLSGGETRDIAAHYESDVEFQQSVNRYVHDFEAMLRRVLGERDGGMIAVTLMSSDMGKLYAALAPVIDRKR